MNHSLLAEVSTISQALAAEAKQKASAFAVMEVAAFAVFFR
jgi:hypothetical protein